LDEIEDATTLTFLAFEMQQHAEINDMGVTRMLTFVVLGLSELDVFVTQRIAQI
jgi:hypothetical protein